MEPEQSKPSPFRFTDPRQERIYRRLRDIGPGPAAFYRDACQLMESSAGLASTTHIIAHLLREVESALRDVLESIVEVSRPQPTGLSAITVHLISWRLASSELLPDGRRANRKPRFEQSLGHYASQRPIP